MKINFIPLDYDYKTIGNKTYMLIYGKTSEGKTCCVIDKAVNFFYILNAENPEKMIKNIEKISQVKKAEITEKNYLEKPERAIKVFCEYNQMQEIARKIELLDKNTETRERDINQITRYILEKKIKPLVWYEIEGNIISDNELNGLANSLDVDLVIELEKIKELKEQIDFKPKILAFDIEAEEFEIGKGEILMISLVSDNIKKVLTWKYCKKAEEYVECFKNEAEMIEKFADYIKKINPDIITGYYSDGFDLPYLRVRAEKNKIDLKLGKDGSRILFSRGNLINARIKGLVHIDLLKFIETVYSQYLQSETLSLNEVSKELLGESKLEIDHNKKSGERNEEEWKDFFSYNLQDSILTYKLFQKFWPDFLEFAHIVQEPLFQLTRYGMSHLVENYIIHNLERFNEIAEKRPIHEEIAERREREKYEGAFVLQPSPGLYENLAVFDFTSYWPSIIVTYNLSLSTFLGEKKQLDSFEVPVAGKKYYFSNKTGFFSSMLKEIIILRKKYKEEYKKDEDPIKKARSNAYKLLANASYGYQGFFGARYYCPEASASATSISRDFTKKIIETINKKDYEVIYSDTDSIAFKLNKHTKQEALNFLKKLNSELPGIMELELEDFYKRGIWVTKRTGEFGAKKKYALVNFQDKIKIRGFETVRRDWCFLAREVQNNILKMILNSGKHEKALEYIKEIIKKIKQREIDKKELIIRTQLKKPLAEYKSISPHVIAAQKIKERGEPIDIGMLISYFIAETQEKKKLVREKVKLPDEKGEYNIDYYLNNQILPAVENIFQVFNINIKEIVEGKKQKKLGEF